VSSIVPCDDDDTQLCIVNSREVRSDEICAESVLSTDDAALQSKTVKVATVEPHPVTSKQQDNNTVNDNAGIQHQPHSKRRTDVSGNRESSFVTTSRDACHRSDAAADTGNKHVDPVQKKACHPRATDSTFASITAIDNENMKSASQV